jgi:hypothetical protein
MMTAKGRVNFDHVVIPKGMPPLELVRVMGTPRDANIYFDSVLIKVVEVEPRFDEDAPLQPSGLPKIRDITLFSSCEGEPQPVPIKIFREGQSSTDKRLGRDALPIAFTREERKINRGMHWIVDVLQRRLAPQRYPNEADALESEFVEVILPLRKTAPVEPHDTPLIAHEAHFIVSEVTGDSIPTQLRIVPILTTPARS